MNHTYTQKQPHATLKVSCRTWQHRLHHVRLAGQKPATSAIFLVLAENFGRFIVHEDRRLLGPRQHTLEPVAHRRHLEVARGLAIVVHDLVLEFEGFQELRVGGGPISAGVEIQWSQSQNCTMR